MEINQRNLVIAAIGAVVLLGGGAVLGSTVLAPKDTHEGENAAAHVAELGMAQGEEQEGEGHADEESEAEQIEMDDAALKASGIVLEKTVPGTLMSEVSAQATVAAAPDGEAILTARAAGAIIQIKKRLGDPVARGETVAVVSSPEAAALAAARSSARGQLELAKSTYERERRLFEAKITARQELEAAEAELGRAQAEFTSSDTAAKTARVSADGSSVSIASPIAGRITFVSEAAKLGAYVSPEEVLFRIADPKRIQIEAAVPVTDASRIAPGDLATVDGNAGSKIMASVRSVTPGIDAESRSATVVLALKDELAGLQPGQFVRVLITPASNKPVSGRFVLPEEAVQSVEGRDVVFVRNGDKFTATPVKVGSRGGGRIEVVEGLKADQAVAGKSAFLLKAELSKGEAEH